MKTRILQLILAALCFAQISCTLAARSQVRADGTKDTQVYAQVGGAGGYSGQADGSMVAQADNQKSFRDVMVMAGVVLPSSFAAKTEQATVAATAATQQTGLKTAAKVQTTAIQEMGTTARSVGNNPEANTGAINAVGNLFKRSP